jgi:hypothetical protein
VVGSVGWCGVVWCARDVVCGCGYGGVVWWCGVCGLVWCDVVWCGVVLC